MAQRRGPSILGTLAGLGLFATIWSSLSPAPPTPPAAVTRDVAPSPAFRAHPSPWSDKPTLAEDDALPPLSGPKADLIREIRYVTASSLILRKEPSQTSGKLDSLTRNSAVTVVGRQSEWLRISTPDGHIGWVAAAYTSERPAAQRSPPKHSMPATVPKQTPTQIVPDTPDKAAIIQQIIEESIASYDGNCPCPFNSKSNGNRCGGNSAWSRPGGGAPICFPSDVTPEMIARFR